MELIVDNFAGGGGVSCGIEMALNRMVDVAINHDYRAILMHKTNHPNTIHYQEDVWSIDPVEVTKGRPVALAWFSPDCKHFSKAKGTKPVDKNIRGLAWVAIRWASKVRPRVIIIENVEEFRTWGPVKNGKPIKKYKGRTFKSFLNALTVLGYKFEYQELKACDYGAPTTRKRFFLIARCDGKSIVWPKPTHNEKNYLVARDIIDWSIKGESIFNRKKPLSEATLKRIVNGIYRFIDNNNGAYSFGDKAATLIQMGYGDSDGRRSLDLNKTIGTITAGGNKFGVAYVKLQEGNKSNEEVKAFIMKYYNNGIGQSIYEPLHTITTKDTFGLVTIKSKKYVIVDIEFRMLQPHELFKAQGFPEYYVIDRDYIGNKYPKSEQIAKCGNSVPPPLVKALVQSNLPELIVKKEVG